MEETLGKKQAGERVDQHIEDAVAVLPESVRLERRGNLDSASCDDADDNGPNGRVTVSKKYRLRDLPAEENEEHAAALYEHWTGNGYTVLQDSRPDERYIWVEHEEGSFRMALRESSDVLSLTASSPCVWPDGTPHPD
ncbi:hypothetical protein [Halostreptopolyspora alba]